MPNNWVTSWTFWTNQISRYEALSKWWTPFSFMVHYIIKLLFDDNSFLYYLIWWFQCWTSTMERAVESTKYLPPHVTVKKFKALDEVSPSPLILFQISFFFSPINFSIPLPFIFKIFPCMYAGVMGGGRSDWPGLFLICYYQPSCVISQQSWFGLLCFCFFLS